MTDTQRLQTLIKNIAKTEKKMDTRCGTYAAVCEGCYRVNIFPDDRCVGEWGVCGNDECDKWICSKCAESTEFICDCCMKMWHAKCLNNLQLKISTCEKCGETMCQECSSNGYSHQCLD